MGKKPAARQGSPLWVTTSDLPTNAGHSFFEHLNRVREEGGFDAFVEGLCAVFYAARMGRPSLRPGRYFRMLFIGYFEGLSSERGIAWRVADSLSLRLFLDLDVTEAAPNHSTLSRTRRLIAVETHEAVQPDGEGVEEVVADKGSHSDKTLVALDEIGVRSYISEPERGRRRWQDKKPGGLRRVRVRGQENVRKRVLIQAAGCNRGLLLRTLTGVGTPRSLQGRALSAICGLIGRLIDRWERLPVAWGSKRTPAALAGSIAHCQAG